MTEEEKKIYNKALDNFAEIFADRIKYDEEVVYVNSDEYVSVSRASVQNLVNKLIKEIKQ